MQQRYIYPHSIPSYNIGMCPAPRPDLCVAPYVSLFAPDVLLLCCCWFALGLYSIARLTTKYTNVVAQKLRKNKKLVAKETASCCLFRSWIQWMEQIIFCFVTCVFSVLILIYQLTAPRPAHMSSWHIIIQYVMPIIFDLFILIPIHLYIQKIRIHYIAKHSDTN